MEEQVKQTVCRCMSAVYPLWFNHEQTQSHTLHCPITVFADFTLQISGPWITPYRVRLRWNNKHRVKVKVVEERLFLCLAPHIFPRANTKLFKILCAKGSIDTLAGKGSRWRDKKHFLGCISPLTDLYRICPRALPDTHSDQLLSFILQSEGKQFNWWKCPHASHCWCPAFKSHWLAP